MPSIQGYQEWKVPTTGSYEITAAGAEGGQDSATENSPGRGAKVKGTFNLNSDKMFNIYLMATSV